MFQEAEDSISKRQLEVFHEEEDNIHGLFQSQLGDLEEEDKIHGLSQAELDDLDEQDDAFEAQMRASNESLPITNETLGDSGHESSTREDESNGILTSAQAK
jgi:hypothetical protein